MKVYIKPEFNNPDQADGGIRRVVEALHRYLPDYGVEVVGSPDEADVINCHAGDLVDGTGETPIVASCHGLYWSNYRWPQDCYLANQLVIETMARSKVVTAPSRWVAQALRRGIYRPVVPIHHGVNVGEWWGGDNLGYVLWNKARVDVISDPGDMNRLAELLPQQKFITTVGQHQDNVTVIGPQPYDDMKAHIQGAGLYLATARETFGIGTLEAMACGVPVVGWAYGGQQEIITQGETGYLVAPGDYAALAEVVQLAQGERGRLSENCVADVRARWGWAEKVEQYAKVFHDIWTQTFTAAPKLSLIVTCYNLGRYLGDCLTSVLGLNVDWECIIVDDCSDDDTAAVAHSYCEQDERFLYVKAPHNLGLSGARNLGVAQSSGRYILPLDADDRLIPEGVGPLIEALDTDPGIHIAYGNLVMMSADGLSYNSEMSKANAFDWLAQMSHVNQPFYCTMMRREVIEESGGYRRRDWRAEDASFWCRVTSFGFRAKKVTEAPTIFYRLRSDSKGATERAKYADGDGDWAAWYGWRVAGTVNHQAGLKSLAKGIQPDPALVPFAAQDKPPSDVMTWDTDHRQAPLISVIIPVGPGHEQYLVDTLDSLTAQTFANWEAIVGNDTGQPLDLSGQQWATVVTTGQAGAGAGAARNVALRAARGDLVLFLDGDDYLLSGAMRDMLTAFVEQNGERYIYTNYVSVNPQGDVHHERLHDYEQTDWRGQHAVTVLMRRADAVRIGGFDEALPGWEDWDFAIKCAVNGICGYHIPIETFVYRAFSGERRDKAAAQMNDLLPILEQRYKEFYKGGKPMSGCGCKGNGADVLMKAKQASSAWRTTLQAVATPKEESNNMTRMEFIGQQPGSKTFKMVLGRVLSREYRGGNNSLGRFVDAAPQDVAILKSSGLWKVAARPVEVEAQVGVNLPPPVVINYEQVGQEVAATAEVSIAVVPAAELDGAIKASPTAIKEAEAAGLDLNQVKGTGAQGKITVRDVRVAARS